MNYLLKARVMLRSQNTMQVAAALVQEAQESAELRKHLVELGAQQLVRNALTSDRRDVSSPRDVMLPAQAGREARQRWVDQQRLYGGTITLGDATWRDLANSARAYDKAAEGNAAMALWHRKLGGIIKLSGKTVRDVISDDKARELKKECKA